MHFHVCVCVCVCDVFYSQFSHHHISANIAAIFRVLLLQEYQGTYVVSCVIVTPQQLKNIIISVKIMYVIEIKVKKWVMIKILGVYHHLHAG